MGTYIGKIKGSFHVRKLIGKRHRTVHDPAEISVSRFHNGSKKGISISLLIEREDGECTSIHLTEDQCYDLSALLRDSFDLSKYPTE